MKKITFIILAIMLVLSTEAYSQKIEIIPVDFNSTYDDFAPCLTQYGRLMYFTSERSRGQQKIFVVERTKDGWGSPDRLPSNINDGLQNGSVAMTPDGQFMIFAAYDNSYGTQGRTDLYSARKVKGEWTDVKNLGPDINSDYWDSQPTLSSDGTTLYFASDRPGGFGGIDIYMSKRTNKGWSKATNLGSFINSSDDDMAPIIAADNSSFTFASNRSGGQGGFDIYITKKKDDSWGAMKNAGVPINSAADDMFYYSQPNSNIAYFSSNRSGGSGELDIYTAVPNPYQSDAVVLIQGIVRDAETNQPLGCDIIVTDLRTQKKVAEFQSDDESGNYYVILQPGRTYSITAEKEGYIFYSDRFEIPATTKGYEETKDIYLSPTGTRLLLFFDFDKSILKDESIPELERVIEYLRDHPDVNIQVEGHTDDQGTHEYNDKLSLERAQAVRQYLISAGIPGNRISAVGYGKRKPLVDAKTDEARAKNRRVEMKILK